MIREGRAVHFDMEGFKMYYTNQDKKRVGGCTVYVGCTLKCMSLAIDGVMECVAVEN